MAAPKAELTLTAKNETQRAFAEVLASLNGMREGAESLKGTFERVLGAAGLGFGLKEIFDQTVQAERAQARLQAVLKSTGNAAGLTATQIDGLVNSLADATNFDDDDLKAGITSLLRFRDLQGDTFQRAAELATDLAVSTGDLSGAFVTLGRLANEPAEALRALVAQGYQLNQSQIDLAKNLEASGDKAGAQKVAFDELAKSIGGTARGETGGLYGGAKSVEKAWNDMLKELGRTDGAGGVVIRTMGEITRVLRELQIVINQPGWDNKLKLIVSEPGTLAKVAATLPKQEVTGRLTGPGAPDVVRAQEGLATRQQEQLDEQFRAEKKRNDEIWAKENERLAREGAAAAKAAAAEAKQRKEKELREWEDAFKRQFEAEEDFQKESAEAWNIYTNNVIEMGQKRIAEANQNALDWAGITDIASFRDTSSGWGGNLFGKEVQDDIEKTSDTMRELGVTFQSAAEDSILAWKGFGSLLQGIEKDILRLGVRKLVTEPLFTAGAGLFGAAGDWLKGLFTSANGNVMTSAGPMLLERFAGGGIARKPTLSLFGEGRMPEAYVPLPDGRSIPVTMQNGGAGGNVAVNVNVDASGNTSVQGDAGIAQALGNRIGATVRQVLVAELRPGGMLARG